MEKPVLTQRQDEIYRFLKDKILKRGYGPTVREIGAEFGIRSPNGVMCHLKALEKKGLITREAHMARAIQLSNQPVSRSAVADIGRLDGTNPWEALDRGNESDFASLFENPDNFAVTASGDTLLDAHVADGDTVVLSRSKIARNGDIVLALIDDASPVLRFYSKDGNRVKLEGSGKTKPIQSDRVQIVAKATAIIRKL